MRIVAAGFAIVLVGSLSLSLAGCSSPSQEVSGAGSDGFKGPWAAEFQDFYDKAESDFERGALADGAISEQEFLEMTERFRSCLSSADMTFSGFEVNGGYSVEPPATMSADAVHEKTISCSEDAGEPSIGALYSWISRNPDNQSEASIMVKCMTEKGIVDASYTVEDWTRDNAEAPVPTFIPENQVDDYEACVSDPLGLFGG